MNNRSFRMPARRIAVAAAATALAAGPAALAGAASAHATGDHGRAGAVVLRTELDVALLDKTARVPLAVTLNDVQAPQSAEKTLLTAELKGVDKGRPFTVARADVASARATVTGQRAEGAVKLVHAKVHVPGLPLLSLIEVEQVTSRAVCETGRAPTASADLPGSVTVLGKKVTLSAKGTAEVVAKGVGTVRLDLSRTETTTHTAAATALELQVSVAPSKSNVARVDGTVTLARATCETPGATGGTGAAGASDESDGSGESGASGPGKPGGGADGRTDGSGGEATGDGSGGEKPDGAHGDDQQAGKQAGRQQAGQQKAAAPAAGATPQGGASGANLAETGGNSMTPYIAGGAVALLAAGGGAVVLARRARR
ncbi:SCO1860 family LAETG-anchored protein [Streptomyces sp. CRN 30]|uniref:SCO1860 family LAETG-anchored protein n=1 Tax=Streptomyces sp. CRN 30 TaxID=3075613 RepID=UPI002A824722|nr:SCO1860 family LAETG-anchored protein [Streptomyces sp. CRN 30]